MRMNVFLLLSTASLGSSTVESRNQSPYCRVSTDLQLMDSHPPLSEYTAETSERGDHIGVISRFQYATSSLGDPFTSQVYRTQ
jgi:hypothetical protein